MHTLKRTIAHKVESRLGNVSTHHCDLICVHRKSVPSQQLARRVAAIIGHVKNSTSTEQRVHNRKFVRPIKRTMSRRFAELCWRVHSASSCEKRDSAFVTFHHVQWSQTVFGRAVDVCASLHEQAKRTPVLLRLAA
jgi:hypothetical protein